MRTFIYSAVAAATMALAGVSSAFAQGQIIIINNNAPGVGFNDPTPAAPVGGNPGLTLGSSASTCSSTRRTSGKQVLQPKVDILVQAQFVPLAPERARLGGRDVRLHGTSRARNVANTWYHSALADHLAGADLNPGFADIVANFSTNFEFYFGFDNNEGALVDLLPVCCTSWATAWASPTSSTS